MVRLTVRFSSPYLLKTSTSLAVSYSLAIWSIACLSLFMSSWAAFSSNTSCSFSRRTSSLPPSPPVHTHTHSAWSESTSGCRSNKQKKNWRWSYPGRASPLLLKLLWSWKFVFPIKYPKKLGKILERRPQQTPWIHIYSNFLTWYQYLNGYWKFHQNRWMQTGSTNKRLCKLCSTTWMHSIGRLEREKCGVYSAQWQIGVGSNFQLRSKTDTHILHIQKSLYVKRLLLNK